MKFKNPDSRWASLRSAAFMMVLAILLSTMNSCSNVDEAAFLVPENISIQISGPVVVQYDLAGDDIIRIRPAEEPVLRPEEYQMDISLNDGRSVRLLAYNFHINNPFSQAGTYNAYPLQDLDDRAVYVIVQYMDEYGQMIYSTTNENTPWDFQLEAFEILTSASGQLYAKFNNIKLYNNEPLRQGSSGAAAQYISISGNLVMNY